MMAADNLLPTLSALSFSSGLSEDILTILASVATMEVVPERAVIFREGQFCRDTFLVAAGRVDLHMHMTGRGDVPLLSLGPGDLLGWSGVLASGTMTATAVAAEPCMIIRFPADKLLPLCCAEPRVGFEVMAQIARALAQRLLATRLQLLELQAETAPSP